MAAQCLAPPSFDTSHCGVAEAFWTRWSRRAQRWAPPVLPLIVVSPHPDDETLGAGGLISEWAARDLPVTVISVTDGEGAFPEIADLAQIRLGELVGALDELTAGEADIMHLHLPDGGVAAVEATLTAVLTACVPREAVLVAPFELDGHPDHEAVGRCCLKVAATRGALLARYPIWAWHTGSAALRSAQNVHAFGLSDPALAAKRRALSHFHSQTQDCPGGAVVPAHVLQYFQRTSEYFLL